jgi:hypothetical protein
VTDADGADATLADRIAARGRDALVERLRKAYADAAVSHSDIVSLDGERIEALVQSAADRADGLQWRRALANVASEELGVSLAEALTHPAVREAQEQLGAPSYEASLAELVARPVPPPAPEPVASEPEPVAPEPEPVASDPASGVFEAGAQLEGVQADETYVELMPEPTPIDEEPGPAPVQPELMIDEPEEHGATGELEAVEADDAIFELLPPPEPLEYEDGSYEALPAEVEAAAPPLLEQVPYEPEAEAAPPEAEAEPAAVAVGVAVAEPAAAPEPSSVPVAPAPAWVGEPTQAHALDDVAPELTAPLAPEPVAVEQSAVVAPEEVAPIAAPESYGENYGSEHTDYPPPPDENLQVLAYHLGGVANLPTGRDGLDLRLSESGLDILQPQGEIIGRLHWNEIDALEVIAVRGRLRRQARTQSRIVVRTKHGDASFEIPGLSSEDLEARVEPLISRYASA